MTFYLQFGLTDNREGWREERWFLDDHVHAEAQADSTIEAASWIEARAKVPG